MIEYYDLIQLIEPLEKWFLQNARELPWRQEPKAYYIWISEIMLQQTRVEAVKGYFERFVGALPDIEALADAIKTVYADESLKHEMSRNAKLMFDERFDRQKSYPRLVLAIEDLLK